jgi:hypothetical protein
MTLVLKNIDNGDNYSTPIIIIANAIVPYTYKNKCGALLH